MKLKCVLNMNLMEKNRLFTSNAVEDQLKIKPFIKLFQDGKGSTKWY